MIRNAISRDHTINASSNAHEQTMKSQAATRARRGRYGRYETAGTRLAPHLARPAQAVRAIR
jgi:hypothetical protein